MLKITAILEQFQRSMRCNWPSTRLIYALLLATGWAMPGIGSANVVINMTNNSGLTNKMYCIQGYSLGTNMMLSGNQLVPLADGPLPGTSITNGQSIILDLAGDFVSGRIYAFVVDLAALCPTDLILVSGGAVTSAPGVGQAKAWPPYIFSEPDFNASGGANTFDLSQVDAYSFPAMASTTNTTSLYTKIGQTEAPDITWVSIVAQYGQYMNQLGALGEPYKALAQAYTTDFPAGTANIVNPNSYLSGATCPVNVDSELHTAFDDQLNALFSRSNIKLWFNPNSDAPYIGSTQSDVTIPGTSFTQQALVFTRDPDPAYQFLPGPETITFFNPVDQTVYSNGNNAPQGLEIWGTWTATDTLTFNPPMPAGSLVQGMFVGGGTGLNYPSNPSQISAPPSTITGGLIQSITVSNTAPNPSPDPAQYCFSKFPPAQAPSGQFASSGGMIFGNTGVLNLTSSQQASDLSNLILEALNRGVANTECSSSPPDPANAPAQDAWCWAQETNWYPASVGSGMNQYANFMHAATIGGTSISYQPNNPANNAQNQLMAMAYGFAFDETPAAWWNNPPTGPAAPLPAQVPSKWDSTITDNPTIQVVYLPWIADDPALSVTLNGGGAVTSSPAGINCGTTCSAPYAQGTSVTLTATPASGFVFSGWSGDGTCSGTSTTCSVTMNAAHTVTATFTAHAPTDFGLTVQVAGSGTVSSTPPGINCGQACSASYASGTSVVLAATAAPGAHFAGWSGACAGTSTPCTVTMDQARTVGAAFVANAHYTLSVNGAPGGIVTSEPAGIDCGTTCTAGYAPGTPVNLIARALPGFIFTGWTGACSGTQTCDLTMNSNQTVGVGFKTTPVGHSVLTVHDYGSGTVTGTHTPPPASSVILAANGDIHCGRVCTQSYTNGTVVTLTARPALNYQFSGWSGPCAGTGACVVTVNSSIFVNAKFLLNAPPQPIPTLTEWAQWSLALGLMVLAGWRYRTVNRGR
jgi:uncharacterized repeat protein (TIGR02543 family)